MKDITISVSSDIRGFSSHAIPIASIFRAAVGMLRDWGAYLDNSASSLRKIAKA